MNGHLVDWLIGAIGILWSLLLGIVAWAIKEHIRSDEKHREDVDKVLELIRQRQHDTMNDVAGLMAVINMRKKERD